MSASRRQFLIQCGVSMTAMACGPLTAATLATQAPAAQPGSRDLWPGDGLVWIDREQALGAHGWHTVAWRVGGTVLRVDGERLWLQSMVSGDHHMETAALDSAEVQQRIQAACGPVVLEELCQARGMLLRR